MKTTTTMTLFCILALFGGFALALEDAPLSASHQQRPNFLIGLGLGTPTGKRAYSYVSEYKRLPIYNFGLGKRRSGPPVENASENKRTRFYSFGLGKRSDLFNARPFSSGLRMSSGYIPNESYENYSPDDYLGNKRSSHRLYSFGIGKRPNNENIGQRFLFGLGKRDADEEEKQEEVEEDEEEEDASV